MLLETSSGFCLHFFFSVWPWEQFSAGTSSFPCLAQTWAYIYTPRRTLQNMMLGFETWQVLHMTQISEMVRKGDRWIEPITKQSRGNMNMSKRSRFFGVVIVKCLARILVKCGLNAQTRTRIPVEFRLWSDLKSSRREAMRHEPSISYPEKDLPSRLDWQACWVWNFSYSNQKADKQCNK